MSTKQQIKEESGASIGCSLFSSSSSSSNNNNNSSSNKEEENEFISFAEQFKDKVKAIHEHFDTNQDGFLNFQELSKLQECTSGQTLDGIVYGHICQAFNCRVEKGLSLEGLKLTYASEGADVEEDYEKIFGKSKTDNSTTINHDNDKTKDDDDSKTTTSNSTNDNAAAPTTTNQDKESIQEQQQEKEHTHTTLKVKINDKVKQIHEHFDTNQDGYLNFRELSNLQACTTRDDNSDGQLLEPSVYDQVCVQFGCDPAKGLSLDGLNLTYATEVTNLDEDYKKVFSGGCTHTHVQSSKENVATFNENVATKNCNTESKEISNSNKESSRIGNDEETQEERQKDDKEGNKVEQENHIDEIEDIFEVGDEGWIDISPDS